MFQIPKSLFQRSAWMALEGAMTYVLQLSFNRGQLLHVHTWVFLPLVTMCQCFSLQAGGSVFSSHTAGPWIAGSWLQHWQVPAGEAQEGLPLCLGAPMWKNIFQPQKLEPAQLKSTAPSPLGFWSVLWPSPQGFTHPLGLEAPPAGLCPEPLQRLHPAQSKPCSSKIRT